jgi:hypothetical protein
MMPAIKIYLKKGGVRHHRQKPAVPAKVKPENTPQPQDPKVKEGEPPKKDSK